MNIVFLLVVSVLTASSPLDDSAQLNLLSGQTVNGQLQAVSADGVTIATGRGTESLRLADVLEIRNANPRAVAAQPQEVRLKDGSILPCEDIRRTAQEVTAESASIGTVKFAASAVAAVRLQTLNEGVADQWNTFLDRETDKDLLVVPKRDGSGLDFLAGIVSSIGDAEISFLLDGDTIPVPSSRVFGIVFAGQRAPALSGSTAIITAADDVIQATEFSYTEGMLTFRSSWGQTAAIPWSAVKRVDLSRGRIHYLSDLKPLTEDFMGLDPEGDVFAGLIDPQIARQLYGPARDRTIEGRTPIRLRGTTYSRGMCIHSRSQLTFALDGRYKLLEAIAGVDDQVAFNLDRQVLLVVSADGEELYRHTFSTRDAPEPLSIALDGAQTLTILVDYADNNSQCDWLDLADARLILKADSN